MRYIENNEGSLEDVIEALSLHPFGGMVYIGKNYSKADLVKDLRHYEDKVKELTKESKELAEMVIKLSGR